MDMATTATTSTDMVVTMGLMATMSMDMVVTTEDMVVTTEDMVEAMEDVVVTTEDMVEAMEDMVEAMGDMGTKGPIIMDVNEPRHRHRRAHRHLFCHKKGRDCHRDSSSSCISDSDKTNISAGTCIETLLSYPFLTFI